MLTGKKIQLRPLKLTDIENTLKWRNDLEIIMLSQGIRFPKTRELEEDWYHSVLHDKSNNRVFFGIDLISNMESIGIVQITKIDYISGTCELGIMIGDKANRGKGYGNEAYSIIINYAFNILNLRKVNTFSIVSNSASLKMKRKISGFTQEGILKKHVFYDGIYHDVIIMALFKEDYYETK